jgi:hypothetical protein
MARKAAKKAASLEALPEPTPQESTATDLAQELEAELEKPAELPRLDLPQDIDPNGTTGLEANSRPKEWTSVECPVPRDPAMGDKTPAVMDWYHEHAPDEYARRYGNRVTPHSTGERQVIRQDLTGPDPTLENEEEPERKPKVITE